MKYLYAFFKRYISLSSKRKRSYYMKSWYSENFRYNIKHFNTQTLNISVNHRKHEIAFMLYSTFNFPLLCKLNNCLEFLKFSVYRLKQLFIKTAITPLNKYYCCCYPFWHPLKPRVLRNHNIKLDSFQKRLSLSSLI